VRPFKPDGEPRDLNPTDKTRANHIVDRVLALDAETAASLLAEVLENFKGRHRNLLERFEARADEMEDRLRDACEFTQVQRRLVGSYFLHEYSFEAAALFNPSIVSHPDQSRRAPGRARFILSVRAVGEGHISSLTFRSGTIAADGSVSVDPTSRLASIATLRNRMARLDGEDRRGRLRSPDGDISERVIFPVTAAQSNGIEDARFVAFDEDGRRPYSARPTPPITAGHPLRADRDQRLPVVPDVAAAGLGARQQGHGAVSAQDRRPLRDDRAAGQREPLFDLFRRSPDLGRRRRALKPQFPWEFMQIGNCGSPIELDEGWLLLTHGVGPVRKYSIGAVLLDKADPSKVLARSREPFVRPEPSEREGYVPNVVYTCGAMRHNDQIILPYAVSDTFCNFATPSEPASRLVWIWGRPSGRPFSFRAKCSRHLR
jgi:hypothetical protein